MTAAELRGGYLFVGGTPTSLWETSYVGAGPGSVLRNGLRRDRPDVLLYCNCFFDVNSGVRLRISLGPVGAADENVNGPEPDEPSRTLSLHSALLAME